MGWNSSLGPGCTGDCTSLTGKSIAVIGSIPSRNFIIWTESRRSRMLGILREAPRAGPQGWRGSEGVTISAGGGKVRRPTGGFSRRRELPRLEGRTDGELRVDGRKGSARQKGRAQEPPQKGGSEKDERDGMVVDETRRVDGVRGWEGRRTRGSGNFP